MIWLVVIILVLGAVFARRLLYLGSDLHKLSGPRPLPLIGSIFSVATNAEDVIKKIQMFQQTYGNIFVVWVGLIPVVNLITPEGAEALLNSKTNIKKGRSYALLEPWLGQGLLTGGGQHWFSHRKLITPTFHFNMLDTFLDVFQDHARTFVHSVAASADSDRAIELQPFISRCTLDVICEAAMGLKMNAQKDYEKVADQSVTNQYIHSTFRLSQLTVARVFNPILRLNALFFRTKLGQTYKKHLDVVHKFANQVIKARRLAEPTEKGNKRLAFLDLLLEARDQNGEPLSDEDIREEVDTFMFEGHDTTAASIVWTLYLLGKHPMIQDEVVAEIQTVFPASGTVTMAHLSHLKVLERAIKEALRLYPSVPNVNRTVIEDLNICGYKIPKGTSLFLHIYQLHRNPDIFPDPEKFDPDRFLPENSVNRHPFAYVPFSAGLRNCVGQKFALLEEKMILAHFLRAYRVEFVGDFDGEQIRTELILRPPSTITFKLKKRTNKYADV